MCVHNSNLLSMEGAQIPSGLEKPYNTGQDPAKLNIRAFCLFSFPTWLNEKAIMGIGAIAQS